MTKPEKPKPEPPDDSALPEMVYRETRVNYFDSSRPGNPWGAASGQRPNPKDWNPFDA